MSPKAAVAAPPRAERLVWKGPAQLRRRVVPIDTLKRWPGNPRVHDLPTIQASLRAFGQYRPIVAQASSRRVIAGHGTMEAAALEGWTGIAVDLIDVGDDAAKMLAVDNRANDLASYDQGLLASFLRTLPDLDATGFTPADLADLLAGLAAASGHTDPDALPAPSKPTTVAGDLWALGPHRLLCGDAGDPASYARLLGEERVDLLWTDPPYGVGYEGGPGTPRRRIMNDSLKSGALEVLLQAAFTNAAASLRPGAAYYVTGPAGGDRMLPFLQALAASGLRLRHILVWVKQSLVMGRGDYHYQHEPILTGIAPPKNGKAKAGAKAVAAAKEPDLEADPLAYGWVDGTHEFHGGRKQSSVWQIPRPSRSPLHPTQKPVELVERGIRNSTRLGAIVLDPFAGSGTTLIAAHRVDRQARVLELDPLNCDVICRRFQEYTGGLLPVRVSTGEEVSFGSS